jgi:hypothetical protein
VGLSGSARVSFSPSRAESKEKGSVRTDRSMFPDFFARAGTRAAFAVAL